jgi:cell division protein FtsQ
MIIPAPKHWLPKLVRLRDYWPVLIGLFIVVDGVYLIHWSMQKCLDPNKLPITNVVVNGDLRHTRMEDMETMVKQAIEGGFFTVAVERIRERILREPWIADATVQRVWPDTLNVTLQERIAIAKWGDRDLLTAEGVVFTPTNTLDFPTNLVELVGPPGTQIHVLARFRELEQIFNEIGCKIAKVSLTPRRNWSFNLIHGPHVVVGRTEFESRVKRLVTGLRRFWNHGLEGLARVDLRYVNGFAVQLLNPQTATESANSNTSLEKNRSAKAASRA